MSSRTLIQLILLVLSLVVIFSYIQPKFLGIQETEQEIEVYETALDQAAQFNGILNSHINKANSLSQTELQALERYLPSSVDEVAVLQDLETIALRSSLTPTSLTIGDGEEGNAAPVVFDQGDEMIDGVEVPLRQRLTTHTFSGTFGGTYEAFGEFLQNLESNAYPLRLVDMSIAPAESQNQEPAFPFSFNLTLETYSYNNAPQRE